MGHLLFEPEVLERKVNSYIQYMVIIAVVQVLVPRMCRGRREPQTEAKNVCVSQMVNLGFVGYIVTTIQLCYCSIEVSIDSSQVSNRGCDTLKLIMVAEI